LEDLKSQNPQAVEAGLPNLDKHVENIRHFGESPIIALNRFADDTEAEIEVVRRRCAELGVPFAVSDHHGRGGEGAVELARAVCEHSERQTVPFRPLYDWSESVPDKVAKVARKMYGAKEVVFTAAAQKDLRDIEKHGYAGLPICIAKTPASLSDDPKKRGRPSEFEVTVRAIQINAGAGFLVVLTGDIMRMPGLPRSPLAESLDLRDGEIVGLR
jgi:formate--tetrahydrofolate ligase